MPRPSRTARLAIATLLVLTIFFYLHSPSGGSGKNESSLLSSRRREIAAAFDHAWIGYSTHCMGYDSLHPVSNTCDDDFGGWGASAIDSLSTAILMEKQDVVQEILAFIETLRFRNVDGGQKINLFEVTIRHLGGMLSAWDLLNGPYKAIVKDRRLIQALYRQILVLGEVLSCAFDTPSGIPRNWVDPAACATDDDTSNTLAGAGTLVLEFSRLSGITGNEKYARLARTAEEYLIHPQPWYGEPFPGLLGSFVNVSDGKFVDNKGSWGSLSDCRYHDMHLCNVLHPLVH